jgi:hypothetical protein
MESIQILNFSQYVKFGINCAYSVLQAESYFLRFHSLGFPEEFGLVGKRIVAVHHGR